MFPGRLHLCQLQDCQVRIHFPLYDPANSVSQSPSYCEPFFNQSEPKQICFLKLIDPGSIRGVTTLTDLTKTLFDMEDTAYWCSSARWQAENNPDIAVNNPGNYAVRI